MGGLVDLSSAQGVKVLSELCSLRLPALSNTRAGGWDIACDHLNYLTNGRCHFSAERGSNSGAYRGSTLHVGSVEVQYFDIDWKSECQTWTKRGEDQNLIIHIPLSGSFVATQLQHTVEVEPGNILIVGSPGDIRRRWRGPCQLLNVVIPPDALNRVMAVEFGVNTSGTLRFEPLTVVPVARVATLLSFLGTIIADVSAQRPLFNDPVLSQQINTTLLQIVLKSLPHSDREAIDDRHRTIAPFYVRRAEDYISEHIHEELSIDDLARAAGVSVRTIFYGFKHYRKLSPMKYIRWLRLREAREELRRARVEPRKISEIAGNFGYGSASQFSRDYKNLFGESPQMTLRRPRASETGAPVEVSASA